MEKPSLELAEIVRRHQDEFLAQYGSSLTPEQRRALRAVAACGTAELGGHVWSCLACGEQQIAYNSCRNRHCPRCQGSRQADWLEREAQHLLPVAYHHVVFTLPAEVAALDPANRGTLYELLFRAAAETIREVAAGPKHLGAQVGLLLVLHTWGQNLHYHPHVHGIVTGGGLSCDAAGQVDSSPRWVACRPGFFLPVRVLSRVYRGKYLAYLRQAHQRGELQGFADAGAFVAWWEALWQKEWVVYSKPPFGGPEVVLKYLARYTHRVALSNRRLLSLEGGRVTFTYRDYADQAREKQLTLSATEFLRRWVQHVLPRGLVKVRHYGLLANRARAEKLTLCRQLLWPKVVVSRLEPAEPAMPRCPACGQDSWRRVGEVPRKVDGDRRVGAAVDSS